MATQTTRPFETRIDISEEVRELLNARLAGSIDKHLWFVEAHLES